MAKDIDYETLVKKAIKALKDCYPPESRLKYSAAVLTDKGNIYTGSNYGSDTATLLLHGEQVTLAHAAAHGDPNIIAIAIAGTGETQLPVSKINLKEGIDFTAPCGLCRQLIYENALRTGYKVKVIMANLKGKHIVRDIEDLVPHPWPSKKHQ